MSDKFHLEKIAEEDDTYFENGGYSGFGFFNLSGEQIEYHYPKDVTQEEVERYIAQSLNNMDAKTVDDICDKACIWKDEKMASDTMAYPDGLLEAEGRQILKFMSFKDIVIYKNPYDQNDKTLGASVGGGTDWDTENGMEIVIKGDEILDVREFLGYGEYAIWDEEDSED
jgi:hypothetical protein